MASTASRAPFSLGGGQSGRNYYKCHDRDDGQEHGIALMEKPRRNSKCDANEYEDLGKGSKKKKH